MLLACHNLIRDHIVTSFSIKPEDFHYASSSQRDGLGKVDQLFSEALPALLNELNEAMAV